MWIWRGIFSVFVFFVENIVVSCDMALWVCESKKKISFVWVFQLHWNDMQFIERFWPLSCSQKLNMWRIQNFLSTTKYCLHSEVFLCQWHETGLMPDLDMSVSHDSCQRMFDFKKIEWNVDCMISLLDNEMTSTSRVSDDNDSLAFHQQKFAWASLVWKK